MIQSILLYKKQFLLLAIRFIGIISLFLSFKLINLISDEVTFGVFSIIVVFSQIGSLVGSFGIPVLTMKMLCSFPPEKRISNINNILISKGFSGVVTNTFFVCVLLLSLYAFFPSMFISGFGWMEIGSVVLSTLFMSLINFNSQILRSDNKTLSYQWLNGNLPYLIFSILLVCCYFLKLSNNWIFLLYVISYLITCIYSFIICLKLEVSFKYSFSIAYYADILKKAFDFFSTQFIQQAFNWVTLLITAYLISEIDTGGINIIVKYISLTSLFLLVTNAYKGPEYTYLFAEGKIKKLNQSISSNTRFIVLCSTPLIIIMMIFPSFFLGLFSIKYVHLSNVFLVMLIGTLVNTFCGSVGMLMQMTQQQTRFRNIMFIALLLHIILSFILSKGYGVLGLGVSLAIVMIYWNIHSSIILQRKHGVISYFKF